MNRSRLMLFCAALVALMPGSARGHDWYSGSRNPVTGASCCGKADCVPVPAGDITYNQGSVTFRYPLDGQLYTIPLDQVLDSRDTHSHACVWGKGSETGPKLCFFAGGGV